MLSTTKGLTEVAAGLGYAIGPPIGGVLFTVSPTVSEVDVYAETFLYTVGWWISATVSGSRCNLLGFSSSDFSSGSKLQ